MPRYDYQCPANGRVIEASHRMSQRLATWGELCRAAGIDPGDTPLEAPVTRLWVMPVIVRDRPDRDPMRHEADCRCCQPGSGPASPIDFTSL